MRVSPLYSAPYFAKKISRVIPGLLMAVPGLLFGQFSFQQMSEPGGLFSTTSQNYDQNTSVETRSISTQYNDYIFTHWTINDIRQVDAHGQALHKIKFPITSNIVAVAHYLDKDLDSDSDNISDWIEIKYSGNLSANAQTDSDGDGIVLRDEVNLGLTPSIDDNISDGGISVRRSKLVAVNLGGAKKLTLRSDPVGLIASTSSLLENNSSFETVPLNGLNNGYYFSHWEVNGVRVSDNKGVGLAQISQSMNEDKVVVAKYFPEDMDSDNDNIPDWYESHYLGGLGQNQDSDSDGDGFTLGEELKLGLSSVIDDNISEGGISVRRSAKVIVNLGGASKVTVKSNPPGLISSSLLYPEVNSTYTTPVLSGLKNGFYFSHWEVNGVRQADPTGLGLSQVTKTLNNDKKFIAKYFAENEDLDDDGLPDWFEWHEQGSLDQNGSSDPDGDGFSLAEEKKLGLSSIIVDQVADGGVSQRRSANFPYLRDANDPTDTDGDGLTDSEEIAIGTNHQIADTDVDGFSDFVEVDEGTDPLLASSFRNVAPTTILPTASLSILENQPSGTFVGQLLATDPNDLASNDSYQFTLVDGNGSLDNNLFQLEANGTLLSSQVLDYEKVLFNNDAILFIRVRVTDSGSLFCEANLSITVLNVPEDYDGDGIDDSLDPDSDNDGFSDEAEIAFGSDPFDKESKINRPPTGMEIMDLNFSENMPTGSLIGKVLASDPDANESLKYSNLTKDENGTKELFLLQEDGHLYTSYVFDFESNESVYSL
ncbi:MAG: cadherin domain-containing protein, partial [Opitutales bacterium]|nr:cadherin domain-containing protein [Opitutales bacterium]